jgi:hypothetical protein
MKRLTAILFSTIFCIQVWAQNEHIFIYGNDSTLNIYKRSELKQIDFGKSNGSGFNTLSITDANDSTVSFNMSLIDSCTVRNTGLPEIFVNLIDYPDITDLFKGHGFTKSTIYPAKLSIVGNGQMDDLSERKVEFRGRGNTTWECPKTPYRFKMEKKQSLAGMKKAKSYALIANYLDCTHMRNATALWIARYLNMPYTNHCVPVTVTLNGYYKGLYMLTEKIGIGSGSVDIDENKGMLFELDTHFDEDYEFAYKWKDGADATTQDSIPVMCKDPDIAEIAATFTDGTTADEYWEKWKADFSAMADAVTSRSADESLSDIIDIESAANYYLVYALTKNGEPLHPRSVYIYKENLGSNDVYHFGPVWDFDWAYTYTSDGKESASPNWAIMSGNGFWSGYSFFKHLFQNEEFYALFSKKLENFIETGYPEMLKWMDEYALQIDAYAVENGIIWPDSTTPRAMRSSYEFRKNLDTLKDWFTQRIAYMKTDRTHGLYR